MHSIFHFITYVHYLPLFSYVLFYVHFLLIVKCAFIILQPMLLFMSDFTSKQSVHLIFFNIKMTHSITECKKTYIYSSCIASNEKHCPGDGGKEERRHRQCPFYWHAGCQNFSLEQCGHQCQFQDNSCFVVLKTLLLRAIKQYLSNRKSFLKIYF